MQGRKVSLLSEVQTKNCFTKQPNKLSGTWIQTHDETETLCRLRMDHTFIFIKSVFMLVETINN